MCNKSAAPTNFGWWAAAPFQYQAFQIFENMGLSVSVKVATPKLKDQAKLFHHGLPPLTFDKNDVQQLCEARLVGTTFQEGDLPQGVCQLTLCEHLDGDDVALGTSFSLVYLAEASRAEGSYLVIILGSRSAQQVIVHQLQYKEGWPVRRGSKLWHCSNLSSSVCTFGHRHQR